MPTSLDELRKQMEAGHSTGLNLQWKASEHADGFDLRIETERYTNRYGEHRLFGHVGMIGEGWAVSVSAPSAFHVKAGQEEDVSRFCLDHQMEKPLVRFGLDESDGELRPSVHLVLGDEGLDNLRLSLMILLLVGACEDLASVLPGAGPVFHDREGE